MILAMPIRLIYLIQPDNILTLKKSVRVLFSSKTSLQLSGGFKDAFGFVLKA